MKLKHVVLYAKGQYSRSEDLVSDLQKCFNGDGYLPLGKTEIASLLVRYLLDIYFDLRSKQLIEQFISDISPAGCWKIGYYTKQYPLWFTENHDDIGEYDFDTSVIKVALSNINQMTYLTLGIQVEDAPDPNILPVNVHLRT